MDLMTILTIVGVAGTFLGVVATIVVYKLSARSPRMIFEGSGILCRCLTRPVFEKGWGIIPVSGKMRVSHQPVTIVDAKLSYRMDVKHVRDNPKPMGKTFPPVHEFIRVANDEAGSIGALSRQGFTQLRLVPGQGEQEISVRFALGGNFAEEYSRDFFAGTFSSVQRMFIPMTIRFQYEHNGEFYWTKPFHILVHPYANMGWTSAGPRYIDDVGNLLEIRHSPAV